MIRKKVLALILAAATALTVFPSMAFAEGEAAEPTKKRVLLYKEDFEGENPEIYIFGNYNNTKTLAASNQFRTALENGNKAGDFYITEQKDIYQRVGYQFSDDGITSGEMDVKFRFKQGANINKQGWAHILMGENNIKGSLLQLLCYNHGKAVKILDDNNKQLLNPIVKDTWYKYEAKLDLSSHKMTASLKNNDDSLINTLSDISVPDHNTKEFQNWPVNGSDTKFKMFGVSIDMVVDDIEIYCDPIEVTDFEFDEETGGKLTFNHNAAEVEDDAITIDGANIAGELSSDGKTYTFAAPSNLVGGKTYTVTVDQSKIKMKAVQASVDKGDNLYGEGSKEFKFTTAKPDVYTLIYKEDFEGETSNIVKFNILGDTSTPTSDTPGSFKKVTEDGNSYGSFHYGLGTAEPVTGYNNQWDRVGFKFSEKGITKGKLRVKFRFQRKDSKNFMAVAIGNNIKRYNWLVMLNCEGANNNNKFAMTGDANYFLKDSEGKEGNMINGQWYNCEVDIDTDTRTIETKVTDSAGKLYSLKRESLAARTTTNGEWKNWNIDGSNTAFQSFGVYYPACLDDIEIYSTDVAPVEKFTTQAEYRYEDNDKGSFNYAAMPKYVDSSTVAEEAGFHFINLVDGNVTETPVKTWNKSVKESIGSMETFYNVMEVSLKNENGTEANNVGFYAIPWVKIDGQVYNGKAFTYGGDSFKGTPHEVIANTKVFE